MAYKNSDAQVVVNTSVNRVWSRDQWSGAEQGSAPVTVTISVQDGYRLSTGEDLRDVINTPEYGNALIQSVTPHYQSIFDKDVIYSINQLNSFVSDLRIELISNNLPADISMFEVSGLASANGDGDWDGMAAFPRKSQLYQSFVVVDSDDMNYTPGYAQTGARPWIVMHEMLHALGMEHNWSDSEHDGKHQQGSAGDNMIFSIMSYYPGRFITSPDTPPAMNKGYSLTPMAIDIAALQIKYGAKGKAAGDTHYFMMSEGLSDTFTDVESGSVRIGQGWYSIWDTGGNDTISFVGSSDSALINLNEAHLGYWSAELDDLATAFFNRHIRFDIPDSLIRNIMDRDLSEGGFISTTWNADGIRSGGYTIAATLGQPDYNRVDDFRTGIENAQGSSGSDVIIGNSKANRLAGGAGDDFIYGGSGNDTLVGGSGADELNGGANALDIAGNVLADVVDYSESSGSIDVDLRRMLQSGGDAEGDLLIDIENVVGSGQRDLIVGDAGDNTLEGRGGDDTLQGGGGTNFLNGGADRDTAVMGDGIDTVVEVEIVDYSQSQSRVVLQFVDWYPRWEGSAGDAEGDRIYGGGLTFKLTDGNDIYGGAPYRPESIFLSGINGDEVVHAGGGHDEIHLRSGSNVAYGGFGNDTIRGDGGRQEFHGEEDDDVLLGSTGQDLLYGGAGFDWIDPGYDNLPDMVDFGADGGGLTFEGGDWGWNSPVGVTVDIAARSWSDRPTNGSPSLGYGLNDVLVGDWSAVRGTSVADHIRGDGAANLLEGRGGNDTIHGGGGNDRIFVNGGSAFGEGDDDTLFAGYETDFLDGGSGNDTIHGSTTARSGAMDTFRGGGGVDYMYGGAGQTTFISADDGDRMYGTGADVVSFADSDHAVTLVGLATAAGTTMEGVYRIFGSTTNDTVTAAPAVYVHGGGGADTFKASEAGGAYGLFGDGGDDVFEFAGSDTPLNAEGGADKDTFHFGRAGGQVYGGSGDDLFVIDPAGGSTSTMWIEDFTRGAGSEDRIKVLGGHSMSDVSVYYDWYYNRTEINVAGFRLNLRGYETLHADDFLFA